MKVALPTDTNLSVVWMDLEFEQGVFKNGHILNFSTPEEN